MACQRLLRSLSVDFASARPRARLLARIAAIAAACAAFPSTAHAHFTLDAPPSWMSQDIAGGPQKQAPCGDEGGGTPTGVVTAFAPGETITVKWTEVIAHDGWFRIALSYANRADLMDPPYQLDSSGNSIDAGIENPPVAPVLVDDLFPHTAASLNGMTKSYSYSLTLPTMPCSNCTLQVIQIMLNHPNNVPYGYTYHHCADISIMAGADGGAAPSVDGGYPDGTSTGAGGSAGSSGGSGSSGAGASGGMGASSGMGGAGASGGSTPSSAGGASGGGTGSNGSGAVGADGGAGNAASASNGGCGCATFGRCTPTSPWLLFAGAIAGLLRLRAAGRRARA